MFALGRRVGVLTGSWDDRQDQVRRPVAVVENGLAGGQQLRVRAEGLPAIGVAVEAREVAAGNLQPNAVPATEHVAGHPEIHLQARGLPGLQQRGFLHPVAVLGANNSIAQIVGLAIGMHVHQLARKVGVPGAGGGPKDQLHRPGDFQVLRQGGRGIDEHVLALFDPGLVLRSGQGPDQVVAPHGGNRVVPVIGEWVRSLVRRFGGAHGAIAFQRSRPARAMDVVGGEAGAFERPLVLAAPAVRPAFI